MYHTIVRTKERQIYVFEIKMKNVCVQEWCEAHNHKSKQECSSLYFSLGLHW